MRGADATDSDEYVQALREAGYAASIFADRVERLVHADMAEHNAGYKVVGAEVGSATVDVEAIVRQELNRLGRPLPTEVARLGASGLGKKALKILSRANVREYDAASYREAIRQAIKDAINPKRSI